VNTEQIKTNLQSKEVQRRIAFAKFMAKGHSEELLFQAFMAITELDGCTATGVHMIQKAMWPIWQSMAVEQELHSER
jgi:hypothetical protein